MSINAIRWWENKKGSSKAKGHKSVTYSEEYSDLIWVHHETIQHQAPSPMHERPHMLLTSVHMIRWETMGL